MRTVCLFLLSFFFIECAAQEPVIGHLAQPETLDDGSMEQLYEDIEDQADAPLDLNAATRSQLEAFPHASTSDGSHRIQRQGEKNRDNQRASAHPLP